MFSKIDLKDAYNQLRVDEESQKWLVINTHKGLFKYRRLPFGISLLSACHFPENNSQCLGRRERNLHLYG